MFFSDLIAVNLVEIKLIFSGSVRVRTGMQPDSLKLTSQLAILKVVHRTAFKLDETQGDKASGKTFYLRGIQGQVTAGVVAGLCFSTESHDVGQQTSLEQRLFLLEREDPGGARLHEGELCPHSGG